MSRVGISALQALLVVALIVVAAPPAGAGTTECTGFSDDLAASDLHDATLVFTGTVTASSADTSTASLKVDRVWKGDVRRDATLFISLGVEEIPAEAFRKGAQYLLFIHRPVEKYRKEDLREMGLPQGTLAFGLAAARWQCCPRPVGQ